jgi:23S rRNA (guanosine2251-2'-O)-methyltransferase
MSKLCKARNSGYWIYGKHAVTSVLKNPRRKIERALITESNRQIFSQLLTQVIENSCIEVVSTNEIGAVLQGRDRSEDANSVVHQGIAVYVKPIEQKGVDEILCEIEKCKDCVFLALDSISDPHNIGAIIRTASIFDVNAVFTVKHESPTENATIIKTASGGFEGVPFVSVVNLVHLLKELKKKGFWIFGLDCSAEYNLRTCCTKRYDRIVFVLGAEGRGIRRLVRDTCDLLVSIPQKNSAFVDSLNVSNAAAIVLYEYYVNR